MDPWDEPRFSSPAVAKIGVKRRRQGKLITESEAKAAISSILDLKEEDLTSPSASKPLPYLGIGRSCSRPEPDLCYVGRPAVSELVVDFWVQRFGQYLIYGPKGVGKSSDFRAAACIITQAFAKGKDPPKERLVFLSAEVILVDEVAAVRNALLFTFLVDEAIGYGEYRAARAVIETINSMDEAVQFVEDRKNKSEKFHFFVDGGEQLDVVDFFAQPTHNPSQLRSEVAKSLNKLLVTGTSVCWCTSAMSDPQRFPADVPKMLYKNRGFNQAEYAIYASNNFLAALTSEDRMSSIKELTGFVPLFLEVLSACCQEFVEEVERAAVMRQLDLSLVKRAEMIKALKPTKERIAELLAEDDNWDAITTKFKRHDELMRVRARAAEIQISSLGNTDEAVAKLDPTYVLDAEKAVYCSSYIKCIYTETVRSKEEELNSKEELLLLEPIGPSCSRLIARMY